MIKSLLLSSFLLLTWTLIASDSQNCISAIEKFTSAKESVPSYKESKEYLELLSLFESKREGVKEETIYQLEQLLLEMQRMNSKGDPFNYENYLKNLILELKEQAKLRERLAGFTALQVIAYRRGLNYAKVLDRGPCSSLYRYSKDHTISQLLREHRGKLPPSLLQEERKYQPVGMPGSYITEATYGKALNLKVVPEKNLTNEKYIANLDAGIKQLSALQANQERLLFRGTLWSKEWVDALITSGQHQDFGYTSLSRSLVQARSFVAHNSTVVRHGGEEKGVLFAYHTKRSVDIAPLSNFVSEAEEIIGREEKFFSTFLGYKSEFCKGIIVVLPLDNLAIFFMTDHKSSIKEEMRAHLQKEICR